MFWLTIAFALLIVGYLGYVVWEAKTEVAESPREDMFVCDRHGVIPAKHVMKLDVMLDKPMEYCPLCYEDRMKEAKEKFKK